MWASMGPAVMAGSRPFFLIEELLLRRWALLSWQAPGIQPLLPFVVRALLTCLLSWQPRSAPYHGSLAVQERVQAGTIALLQPEFCCCVLLRCYTEECPWVG